MRKKNNTGFQLALMKNLVSAMNITGTVMKHFVTIIIIIVIVKRFKKKRS